MYWKTIRQDMNTEILELKEAPNTTGVLTIVQGTWKFRCRLDFQKQALKKIEIEGTGKSLDHAKRVVNQFISPYFDIDGVTEIVK